MFEESSDGKGLFLKNKRDMPSNYFDTIININEHNHNHKSKIPGRNPNKKYAGDLWAKIRKFYCEI